MTSQVLAENIARMAAQGLRLDPPPTEAEIDQILERLGKAFEATPDQVVAARRLLHARFAIRMEMGQTIKVDHVPWLHTRRGTIDPFYWSRYRELLLLNGWSPLVAGTLDRSMDELLDLLGDPTTTGTWKRRGLVVGDVQSGKTASYAALICKAADAGYRMVILLAGTLENVRRQTQERLDAAFVGLDSRDFLARDQLKHKTLVGVGYIDGRRDGIVFTSRDRDFRAQIASALSISLSSVREPVLVVAKKNKKVLSNLATWLRTMNADQTGHIDVPLLLIDDEADNASINTSANSNETTAINKAIRDLLALFRRSSYVGFTATPFANIFIDPTSSDEMFGDDLFPRDFIHLLEPPTNYVGMDRLFAPVDPEHPEIGQAEASLVGIRTIRGTEEWLPLAHSSADNPGAIPASLLTALRQFLLTCAIRDLRVKKSVEGHERGVHRSMLVNVSRFTEVQNKVADQIHVELDRIRDQVRLFGALEPVTAAAQSVEITTLQRVFEGEFVQADCKWSEVLAALHDSISPIRVQAVNQKTGASSLDYSVIKETPGVRVIAVGGNSLSRGLTLEGLCVSYFLRNSRAYDTLLQMSRWFGYRDGYSDLCRIWISAEAEGWYRHVADATNELKRDFARMRRQKATPAEFGLRVRTHPDTLLITARNKMATGIDIVDEVRDISLVGRGIETSRLYADRQRNTENLRVIDRFLVDVTQAHGGPIGSPNGRAELWPSVRAGLVTKLLRDFLVHPLNHDFQGEAIADFLDLALERRDPQLSTWRVALPTEGTAEPDKPVVVAGIVVRPKKRVILVRKSPESLLVSGEKARVGGREDVLHGLSYDLAETVRSTFKRDNPTGKNVPEDAFREVMVNPLLVIYLLRGFERAPEDKEKETIYKGGLVLPAIALHFPGVKDPNAPKRYVSYRLNRVAQAELELGGDDLSDDDED